MTVYYLAPDAGAPKGGVRTIYRHVDTLNAAGIEAAVVHARGGFRCRWFANDTRVVHPPVALRAAHDVLVVPEQVSTAELARLCPGIAKVILNQNAYRTFWTAEVRGTQVLSPYSCPDVTGVLTVSVDSEQYLRHAFPELRVARVRHCIDPAVFHPDPPARAEQIAVMPRKRLRDFEQLHAILALRGVLSGWDLVTIEGLPEADVARTLQRSTLFVSLGKDEGFGLPPAEAMACGCHVIGFHGRGGREFFVTPYAEAVEDGDVIALAQAVEALVNSHPERRAELEQLAVEGSRLILSTFSAEHQSADLVAFFTEALSPPRSPSAPASVLRRRAIERLLPRPGRARTALQRAGRRILR